MKRALLSASLLSLSAAFLATPAYANKTAANKPYVTINGKAISANRSEVLLANQLAQGQALTPELEAAVREEIVRREVLAQEAVKKGIEKRADVQGQLDLARQGVLIGAYLNDYARNVKITDADVQKEYDGIKTNLGDKEYKARHILVDTEGEAKDLIAKLQKGERFEDLAKVSKDPGSKDRGGDMGWANKASYVPQFTDAMVKLESGKFTLNPVQTNFGWHVILLEDSRELKAPQIDEVKPQIVQRLRQVMVERHILDVRQKAKVTD